MFKYFVKVSISFYDDLIITNKGFQSKDFITIVKLEVLSKFMSGDSENKKYHKTLLKTEDVLTYSIDEFIGKLF